MVPGEGYHFTGHTPSGTLNITADEESRIMKDRTDWMLFPRTFREINHLLGPLQVDLFASRLTHQPHRYASWRPILLPNKPDLIQPTCTVNNPDITPRLAAWTISGIHVDSEAKNFQKTLQPYCLHHGDTKLPKVTTPCVASGLAGIVKGVQIPFQEIYCS